MFNSKLINHTLLYRRRFLSLPQGVWISYGAAHLIWDLVTEGVWISNGVAQSNTEAMTSQKSLFAFQHFGYHVSVEHDEKHPQPKFGGNRFMGSPIEISANWPGSKQL